MNSDKLMQIMAKINTGFKKDTMSKFVVESEDKGYWEIVDEHGNLYKITCIPKYDKVK